MGRLRAGISLLQCGARWPDCVKFNTLQLAQPFFFLHFNFTVQIFVFLQPVDQLYLACASLVIFVDRAELSLYAAAVRLDLEWLSSL